MFGRKRQQDEDEVLPGPVAPCTPHRRLTTADYYRAEYTLRTTIEELGRRDAEMDALRDEVERLRAGGGRQLDQATHVDVLVGQLEHINRLVVTLERELDAERTENQRLRDRLAQVPLQRAPAAVAQVQKPDQYSWWLERIDNLETDNLAIDVKGK